MSAVVTEAYSGGTLQSRDRVEYDYDDSGLRVRSSESSDADLNGSFETAGETTTYLVDHHNHTNYAQTITEITKDGTGAETKRVVYTFGHDEISQTTTGAGGTETLTFTHDGHGSVRVLLDALGAIANLAGVDQLFHFTAYGVAHGFAPSQAATSILYSGEAFDARIGQQYLRARWYDPNTGRFNRLDPFFGTLGGPQAFNKYLYTHADPVNGWDPSGLANVPGDVYLRVGIAVHYMFSVYAFTLGRSTAPGATLGTVLPEDFPPGSRYRSQKPDLVDVTEKTYFELKPVTWAKDGAKQESLRAQMAPYDAALRPLGFTRGRSLDLTFENKKLPIGLVRDRGKWYLVILRPVTTPRIMPSRINGRGILWYELDPVRRKKDWKDERRVRIPKDLQIPKDVGRDIEVFDVTPSGSEPGLKQDWYFFYTIVAAGLAAKYYLTTAAAGGAATVVAGNTISLATHTTVSTLTTGIAA